MESLGAAGARSAETLVLALGNPLRGDDGLGTAVLESLAASGRVPAGVELRDGGTPGLDTALVLEGYRRAIVVDAADMGLEPGTWARCTLPARSLQPGASLHAAGLAEALALGDALHILPPEVIIIGVQPLHTDWSPGLSEPVSRAVPGVCEAILWEIGRGPLARTQRTEDDGQDSDCR